MEVYFFRNFNFFITEVIICYFFNFSMTSASSSVKLTITEMGVPAASILLAIASFPSSIPSCRPSSRLSIFACRMIDSS